MDNEKIRQKLLECSVSHHDYLIKSLEDPEEAAIYLQVALDEYQEDGNTEFFMKALRDVAEASGGVGPLAKKTHLNRQNLYNTLSHKGNPRLNTLGVILSGLGFHLSITPIHRAA